MMATPITSADLDRAKVASFDRGYKEGFEAARAGKPYGTTALDMLAGQSPPTAATAGTSRQPQRGASQAGAASWDDIAAQMNAGLPAHAHIPGRRG